MLHAYIDDILVITQNDYQDHIEALKKVLYRLVEV